MSFTRWVRRATIYIIAAAAFIWIIIIIILSSLSSFSVFNVVETKAKQTKTKLREKNSSHRGVFMLLNFFPHFPRRIPQFIRRSLCLYYIDGSAADIASHNHFNNRARGECLNNANNDFIVLKSTTHLKNGVNWNKTAAERCHEKCIRNPNVATTCICGAFGTTGAHSQCWWHWLHRKKQKTKKASNRPLKQRTLQINVSSK